MNNTSFDTGSGYAHERKLESSRFGRLQWIVLFSLLALLVQPVLSENTFIDPLDAPSEMRSSPENRPLLAVARAGESLVAVGSRGLIVYSTDQGNSWTQASVPVQSDLLAVNFPTSSEGWAVGHDGIILYSDDAGKNWVRQLDGRLAGDVFKAFYASMGEDGQAGLATIDINYRTGPVLPWLDVWFENSLAGYVIGSYGLIASTTDGGKNWEPGMYHVDNAEELNLNSMRTIDGNIYIAGEQGKVHKLDRARNHFTRTDSGYLGSFFGITGGDGILLAFGIAGTIFRSADNGESWQLLETPTRQAIVAGVVRSNAEGFVLLDIAGQLLSIDHSATSVNFLPIKTVLQATGIVQVKNDLFIVTGMEGIKRVEIPPYTAANIH